MIGIVAAKIALIAASLPAGLLIHLIVSGHVANRKLLRVPIIVGALAVAIWSGFVMTAVWLLVLSAFLGWTLFALAAIDALAFRLPDALTLPLVAAGLIVSFFLPEPDTAGHIAGAGCGFVALYAVAFFYRQARGREGLGLGDAKLAAGAGAWLGWQSLPAVVLIASAAGVIWFGIAFARRGRAALGEQIPFGVPLCLAIWVVWLYGIPAVLIGAS